LAQVHVRWHHRMCPLALCTMTALMIRSHSYDVGFDGSPNCHLALIPVPFASSTMSFGCLRASIISMMCNKYTLCYSFYWSLTVSCLCCLKCLFSMIIYCMYLLQRALVSDYSLTADIGCYSKTHRACRSTYYAIHNMSQYYFIYFCHE